MEYKVLIKECLKGNAQAQKAMFDHFSGKMLFLCMRYATDQSEAEDMLQEGFVRLYSNLNKFQHKGSFEGWVRRIFVNTAIKYYHKVRKHNGYSQLEHVDAVQKGADALSTLSEAELLRLIRDLPDGYRIVFNMYAIEGYSHKEISELLNIQESTSRSQLVKARKLLQTQVNSLQKIPA